VYLSYGLAVILGFIGAKLVIHALHTNELPFINGGEHVTAIPEIPTWLSLTVILATLLVTTVASLARSRRDRAERAAALVGTTPDAAGSPGSPVGTVPGTAEPSRR
jgi:tellurite resistance protein TerC